MWEIMLIALTGLGTSDYGWQPSLGGILIYSRECDLVLACKHSYFLLFDKQCEMANCPELLLW